MKRFFAKSTAVLLTIAFFIPVLCSCAYFEKSKVLEAASKLVDAMSAGKASDILDCTDGLDRDFKKSFKEKLNETDNTNEEKAYFKAVYKSMTAEIKGDTVKIEKDKATCQIEFKIADVETLKDGDYKDAEALADAVSDCKKKTIEVEAEFEKIDKQWLVTNFDSVEFQSVFTFYENMPAIARGAFLDTAGIIAQAVLVDDPTKISPLLYTPADARDPLAVLFNTNAAPTPEEKAFQAAVRSTMNYRIDESSLKIWQNKGTVDIVLTLADYTTLAGKQFNSIPEIEAAVKACPSMTLKYNCYLVRTAYVWNVTNIEDEGFAAFLSYKKFSINIKSVDGTYSSAVDVTDKFVKYVSSEFSIKMPSDLDGRIVINAKMVLKDGKYEVTVDRNSFIANIKSFAETNIDKIVMYNLGTTSQTGLDALAKIAGYKDYADMRQKILEEISNKVSNVDTSSMESAGTYTVNDNVITFNSGKEVMAGKIDNYGGITVIAPVSDADAKKVLGSDQIMLAFKKDT